MVHEVIEDLNDHFVDIYEKEKANHELFKLIMKDVDAFTTFNAYFALLVNCAKLPSVNRVQPLPSCIMPGRKPTFRAREYTFSLYLPEHLNRPNEITNHLLLSKLKT